MFFKGGLLSEGCNPPPPPGPPVREVSERQQGMIYTERHNAYEIALPEKHEFEQKIWGQGGRRAGRGARRGDF